MSNYSLRYIVLVVLTWVTLVVVFVFSALAGLDATRLNLGIFLNTTAGISDVYDTEITPAGWTFSIWGFVYAYQVLWLLYATSTLFRKCKVDGVYLYTIAPYLHWSVFVIYIFNLFGNISWLFLWDRFLVIPALVLIALLPATLYVCLIISIHGIYKYQPLLTNSGFPNENRYVVGIVHNGLGIYAAWVTIATLINLAIVLTYRVGLPQQISSSIALGVLTFIIIVYVLIDLYFLESYTRFLFIPYVVLVVALIGILAKNYNGSVGNTVFTVVLLVAGLVLFALKIALAISREKRRPAFEVRGDTEEGFKLDRTETPGQIRYWGAHPT